jgi:ornithine cyclodeaminase
VRLFDVDPRATAKLVRNLDSIPDLEGLRVVRAASVGEACRGADIVTTATADKRNAVILTPPMIAPGMHLNAVGGDCPGKTELHPDVLQMPDLRVVVEYEPQSRIEGEVQQVGDDYPVLEFSRIVSGEVAGRADAHEITLFDSVGFALEDYSALRVLRMLLDENHIERRKIDLVPQLEDPKDLYGGTLGGDRRRARLAIAK